MFELEIVTFLKVLLYKYRLGTVSISKAGELRSIEFLTCTATRTTDPVMELVAIRAFVASIRFVFVIFFSVIAFIDRL